MVLSDILKWIDIDLLISILIMLEKKRKLGIHSYTYMHKNLNVRFIQAMIFKLSSQFLKLKLGVPTYAWHTHIHCSTY